MKLSADDIYSIIASKLRRNDHQDFYNSDDLVPGNNKKESLLSRCVSAFANSGGGTIYFGIKKIHGRAAEIIPVDFSRTGRHWLQNILNQEISPPIKNLEINYVPLAGNSNTGVIVINVPRSDSIPHMASDNRFYLRVGLREVVMNENSVRELYGKASLPQIEFLGILNTNGVSTLDNGKLLSVTFYPKFLIRNSGTGIEKYMKFELWIPSVFHDANYTAMQNYFTRLDGPYSVFSFPNRMAIFQEEIITIAEAKLIVDAAGVSGFSESKMIIRLYYSGGMKELSYLLSETFTIDNKVLEVNQFSGKTLK